MNNLYCKYIKRILDIIFSALMIILLSPLYLLLTILGVIFMKGNPFFIQKRPGYKEKIFKLIKFRSMTNEKDKNGNLMSDEKRLNNYGKFLRSTSLDEIPEAFNILVGNMSFVGPRPLLIEYLPRYNNFQRQRHDVKPGLTGLAQTKGRNSISWEEKFDFDIYYINNVSLLLDIRIILNTIKVVIMKSGIDNSKNETMPDFMGTKE